jgi:hypothetical protein
MDIGERRVPKLGWVTGLSLLVFLASGLTGFVLGFGFVRNAGGGLGTALAAGVSAALFCSLMSDWLLARLGTRRRPPR